MEPDTDTARLIREAGLAVRRFTVEEFHRMDETGVLHPDDRVELVDGRIVEMAAIGNPHAACVRRLIRQFTEAARSDLIVDVQDPVYIHLYTEFVPDLTLLRHRDDFYEGSPPGPDDVLLVVEVADTTLAYDRDTKIPRYGGAGIREAWVVNLPERRIEVFRDPAVEGGYRDCGRATEGQSIAPVALPRLSLDIADVLGSPPDDD